MGMDSGRVWCERKHKQGAFGLPDAAAAACTQRALQGEIKRFLGIKPFIQKRK